MQAGVDLQRENVHPFEDEHVVAPSLDPAHAAVGSPAGTRVRIKGGKVFGSVPNQGHGFAVQGRVDQFPLFPVGQSLPGLGVDDFHQKIILPEMHALFLGHSKATPGPFISERP